MAQRVVARVGAAKGQSAHRHRFGRADVRICKSARGGAGIQRYIVSACCAHNCRAGHVEGGHGRAVIDLVVGRQAADCQGFARDVCNCGGTGRSKLVVACSGAAQVQARRRNGLAVADVLVGKGRRTAAQADVVAANHPAKCAGRDCRCRCAVINLVIRGDAAHQQFLSDRERLVHAGGRVPLGIAGLRSAHSHGASAGDSHHIAGNGRRAGDEAKADRQAGRRGGSNGERSVAVSLVGQRPERDGLVGLGHAEHAAERVAQAAGAGGQLLVCASRINFQISEGDDSVAGSGADVHRRGAEERTGAGAERDRHILVATQADGRIVAELVAATNDRLRYKQ